MRHPFAVQVLSSERPEWVHGPYATLPDVQDLTQLIFATRPLPPWPVSDVLPDAPGSAGSLTLDGGCLIRRCLLLVLLLGLWWLICHLVLRTGIEPWTCGLPWAVFRAGRPQPVVSSVLRCKPCAWHACVDWQPVRVTDSTYVLRLFRELGSGFGVHGLLHSANLDLLLALQEAWFDGVTVRKVKAHCLQLLDRPLSACGILWVMSKPIVDVLLL